MIYILIIPVIVFFVFRKIKAKVNSTAITKENAYEFAVSLIERDDLLKDKIEIVVSENICHPYFKGNELIIPNNITCKKNVFYQYLLCSLIYDIVIRRRKKYSCFVQLVSKYIIFLKILSVLHFTVVILNFFDISVLYIILYILPSCIFILVMLIQWMMKGYNNKMKYLESMIGTPIDRVSYFVANNYYFLTYLGTVSAFTNYIYLLFSDSKK